MTWRFMNVKHLISLKIFRDEWCHEHMSFETSSLAASKVSMKLQRRLSLHPRLIQTETTTLTGAQNLFDSARRCLRASAALMPTQQHLQILAFFERT